MPSVDSFSHPSKKNKKNNNQNYKKNKHPNTNNQRPTPSSKCNTLSVSVLSEGVDGGQGKGREADTNDCLNYLPLSHLLLS